MEDHSEVKRIKLYPEVEADGEVSYDILEWFPILVCQNVFKYLNGKDVIQASGVNKEWYKLTGEIQQVKKMKLIVGNELMTHEALQILEDSKRRYQHIEFRGTSPAAIASLLSYFERRSWKSVELSCEIDPNDWTRMLNAIEPTVEELSIDIKLPSDELVITNQNWTFPCLKSLECNDETTDYHINHFVRCTNLVKLDWILDYQTMREAHSHLLTMLLNNHQLEELSLLDFDEMFGHSFRFKLKTLKTVTNDLGPHNIFLPFLESQSGTLESLEMEAVVDHELLQLIFAMPRLTSLAIGDCYDNDQPLPMNEKITSLELKSEVDSDFQKAFETLIRALPNLKHFRCKEISSEMLRFLALEVPDLETFEAEFFDVTRLPRSNIFPKIKKFEAQRFNSQLQEPIGDSHFAKLVKENMEDSERD